MIDLERLQKDLERLIAELPTAQLPDLIGVLATNAARIELRLRAPVPVPASAPELLLVDVGEMARRSGMSTFWLRDQVKADRIPYHRAGRRLLFDPAAVIGAIKALQSKPKKDGRQDQRSWGARRIKRSKSGVDRPSTKAGNPESVHQIAHQVAKEGAAHGD